MDGRGFDADSWAALKTFAGRLATRHDVDHAAAVFALGDTLNAEPIEMALPQPVIWYDDEEEFAAVVVQAERHESDEGELLEVLGLVLPHGETKIAFLEDVDEVDAADPVWRSLLHAERIDVGDQEDARDDDRWLS